MVKRQPWDDKLYEQQRRERAVNATFTLSATASGPLAGVTVLFIGGMAALTQGSLDVLLHVALTSFAAALPFLAVSFIFALRRAGGLSAYIGLGVGAIFEMIGIAAILFRLSGAAFAVFCLAMLGCIVWFCWVFVGAILRERKIRADWKAKGAVEEDRP